MTHGVLSRETQARAQRRRRQRHLAVINELLSVPCMDCGGTYPPECMDFDHRDPADKRFTIGQRLNRSLPVLLAEAEKCDVVCANCHRIRTKAAWYPLHGLKEGE